MSGPGLFRLISFLGLRSRFILIGIAVLVPLVVVMLQLANYERETAWANAEQRVKLLATLTADRQYQLLQQVEIVLGRIANDWQVRAGGESCNASLADAMARHEWLFAIRFSNRNGDGLCADRPEVLEFSVADRDYFRAVLAGESFAVSDQISSRAASDLLTSRTGARPIVVAAVPVFDDGERTGVVAAAIDLNTISELLPVERVNEPGVVVDIIDGNGILLARHPYDPALVGQPGSDDPVVKKALRDPSGTAQLRDLKGAVRLFAFQKVASVDWVVAVGIAHTAVMEPIDTALQNRLGLIAVIVLSSCIIGLVGGEAFVFWPLRALAQTAQALERGDLEARPRVSGVGEVGDLERSLSRMAEAIQQRETDLKTSQAALERAVSSSRRANEAKSQFLASMSHEIRTPLSSIIGYNDLLLAQPLEPEQRRYAERIGVAAATVIAVIDGILDISRIEAREVEIEQRPFRLHALVDNAVSMVRGNAARKGLGLRVELDPALPVAVQGDETRVRQVLLNLLTNAIKFTASGSVSLRVQRARREGRIRFTVLDTGIGIAKEQHHRLFKRFSQVHDKRGRDYGGTGLGLAISKELTELMGGELGFSSKPAQGSTFWMELALPRADEAEIAPQSTSVQPARAGLILVADDQEMSREITSAMLTMAGHEVDVVTDGAEAVEAVQRRGYDLVLMDIQMSGMDGLAAMRRIRRLDGPARKVPVIAMTANVMPQQVRAFTRAGMDDHLGKPFTRDQLISKVNAFLTPSQAARGTVADPAEPGGGFDQHALDEMTRLLGEERTAAWVNMLRAQLETIVSAKASATPREKLAKTAHSLVSQAGSLGFTKLSKLSGELEEACLQRTDYSATLSHVKKACKEALSRIDRIQNGNSDHLVGTH